MIILEKKQIVNKRTGFGIIKETTQIPANLVSGDDNNAFLSQTWLKLGEKNISPGNFSPAEVINFS